MSRLLRLALVLLGLVSACSDAEPRTQITFRIDASTMLVDRIAKLTVTVSGAKSTSRDFQANELTWPVDIVVYPATNNRGSYSVTLDAIAYDGSGQMIAHTEGRQSFAPKMNVMTNLSLDSGGPVPDAGTGIDAGMNADAGTDAASADSGRDTGSGSDAGGGQTHEDAQINPPNCATLGSNIVCDDGNGCNGTEACDPNN
ncbi:MAG TPA: hypothetical protein VG963_25915, partial [Polyangiaceae bacterium]|nr:hypothetical protein [Polyangiaceae bacterium]